MKKLLILAAWLLAGCATAHTSARNEFLAHRRSVTRLGAFNGLRDPRRVSSQLRRPGVRVGTVESRGTVPRGCKRLVHYSRR